MSNDYKLKIILQAVFKEVSSSLCNWRFKEFTEWD